jgi:biotin carboxyl carrier protein
MKRKLSINGKEVVIDVHELDSNSVSFSLNNKVYGIGIESSAKGKLIVTKEGRNTKVINSGSKMVVMGKELEILLPRNSRMKGKTEVLGSMVAPMPGKVLKIIKKLGENVKKGDAILILEAMKMEHTIKADQDGKIEKIYFQEGEQVSHGAVLVKLC